MNDSVYKNRFLAFWLLVYLSESCPFVLFVLLILAVATSLKVVMCVLLTLLVVYHNC